MIIIIFDISNSSKVDLIENKHINYHLDAKDKLQ